MTHLQYYVCHLSNEQGRKPMLNILDNDKLLCNICRSSFDAFWSRWPGTLKNNLLVIKRTHELRDEVLVISEELKHFGPFILRDEIGMGVD